VLVMLSWPSQSAMTVMSTPARSSRMAAVCLLSTLAVFDRFVSSFGQADRRGGFAIGMLGWCRVSGTGV